MNAPDIPTPAPSGPPPLSGASVFPQPATPSPAPAKPWALKVFGIINLVLAGLTLVGLPMSVMMFYLPGGEKMSMGLMERAGPEYVTWMRILTAAAAVVAGLQIYAGIGLLKAREGARRLAIACAIYGIIAALLGTYVSLKFVLPFSTDMAMQQFSGQEAEVVKNPAFIQMMSVIAKASAIMGIVIALLPPLANLFFLSRKPVRDYCQQQMNDSTGSEGR